MSKILKYSTELGDDGAAYSKELCPYGQTAGECNVVMGLGSHSCSKCRFCEERDPFRQIVKCRFEVLDLSLTFQWYDMIASGEKKEEYRKRNDFYWHRFHACNNQCPPGFDVGVCKVCPRTFLKHYDAVRFHRGQGSPETMLIAVDGIRIGYGREDWGAPKGEQVYIIQLGDRIL